MPDLNGLLKKAGILWHGWHCFRRGLASSPEGDRSDGQLPKPYCAPLVLQMI